MRAVDIFHFVNFAHSQQVRENRGLRLMDAPEGAVRTMVRVIEIDTGISFAPAQRLRMLWAHPNLNFQGTDSS